MSESSAKGCALGKVAFSLQVFAEDECESCVKEVCAKAKSLLETEIAPHVDWQIEVLRVSQGKRRNPAECGYGAINYLPTDGVSQTMTIIRQSLKRNGTRELGLSAPGFGAIDLDMWEKEPHPEDGLIHEWLHTISAEKINGRLVGGPDTHEFEDGPRWHKWYRRMLRWE